MPELLRMPEVAAGATSAIVSSWPLAVGSAFTKGGVVAVIETDKAVVDMEAETDGTLVHLLVTEGTEVAIGDPIALIAAPGESVSDIDAALAALGYSSGGAAPAQTAEPSSAAAPTPSAAVPTPAVPTAADVDASGDRIFASPLARRIARDAGISLAGIAGSGPNGRIRRRDVEAALAAGLAAQSPATSPVSAPVASFGGYRDEPHSRLRRAIAARLTQSKTTAPHFYVRGTARVDRLMAMRAEINSGEGVRVSVNDLVIKAVAAAHRQVPAMNVIWTDDAIRYFDTVDVSVAVATPTGLVTPVVRGVDSLSISQLAVITKDYAERAREGSLRQHELEGGSTSVTNLGMFGTEDFAAIINPPHASILAVGAARQEAIVDNGELAVGTVMKMTLSVDHRPVDGATAAQWMAALISLLENPARILA